MVPVNPRRRSSVLLLVGTFVAVALAACGDESATVPVAPVEAPHTEHVPPRRAGTTEQPEAPDEPEETEAARVPRRSTAAAPLTDAERRIAVALGTGDEAEVALSALDEGRRIAVLRAALRMGGAAAIYAAEHVEHECLDLAELKLAATTLVREGLRPGAEDGAGTLASVYRTGACADVAAVMSALLADPAPLADGGSIESLHKLLRAEHAPLVAKLLENEATRATGEDFAEQLRKRSAAARAVLPPGDPDEAVGRAQAEDEADESLGEARIAALEPLVAESGRYSAFKILRDADPVAARRALERLLTSGSDAAVEEFLEKMRMHEVWPSPWISTRQDSPVYADLDAAVIPAITSPSRLAAIALSVPGCATRRMADVICERCASAAPLSENEAEVFAPRIRQDNWPRAADIHAFLASGASASFLRELRRWAASDPSFVGLLFDARDVTSVPRILEYDALLRSTHDGMIPWREWRRLPVPDVRAFLREHAAGPDKESAQTLESIAAVDGLPEVLDDWLPESADAPAVYDEARRLILAERPVDALCALLAADPDFFVTGLGDVRDPRVVAHLRQLLEKRDVVVYRDVLDELARAGDAAARAELRAGVEEGRYRWITDMTGRQTALGGDPRDVYELWCRQLETNCCVDCCADESYFEHWFGYSPTEIAQSTEFRTTAADAARAWWKVHEGRFVWSDLGERYVPEPR